MYGSSSLCLSDTHALVIDQLIWLLLIKIMIIINEDWCWFPLFIGKFFEKESIWRPTLDWKFTRQLSIPVGLFIILTVRFRRVWCAALPSCGIRNTKSYLRSSRTPVILKANEHGYDSITVLQYWKTIPTAKQNKMNSILMRNVTFPSWCSALFEKFLSQD